MTEAEIAQITLDHWRREYPKEYRKLSREEALRQARGCATLTLMEMKALKLVHPGMTDYEAWTESRHLFCMNPPQVPKPTSYYENLLGLTEEQKRENLKRLDEALRRWDTPRHPRDLTSHPKRSRRRREAEENATAEETE